uniref:Cyclic nucleotide-binding domain-containing protein n=1 Tax=Callorhinchus milii TaxID=7868 RepID=A0A4W3HS97_CALMI
EESAISFDVNYFKPNKIAKKHPEWRTREELESLCSVLRSLISIRHCSKPYQLVLAKVMRYERYRRRRIVLKRGHYPQCCYFVFSGGISFTLDVDGSSAFENEQSPHLQKGGRFGVNVLQISLRIVCMEETELMVVDKEDFYAYKLNEPLQQESVFRFQFFRLVQDWLDTSFKEPVQARWAEWPLSVLYSSMILCISLEYYKLSQADTYNQVLGLGVGAACFLMSSFILPDHWNHRSLKIKSQGVVITRMGKETLAAVADEETMEKLLSFPWFPSDEKLCEYFLEKNSWKIFKKDLVAHLAKKSHQHISQPKCSWKKQEETVYDVDKTGILNLPAIAKQPVTAFLKPSYYIASVKSELEDSSHEVPELRLIHGIAMTRPPLKRL